MGKKRIEEEKVLREIEENRTEKGFCRAVQKDRKTKEIIAEIKDEQWYEYFKQSMLARGMKKRKKEMLGREKNSMKRRLAEKRYIGRSRI